MKFWEKMEKIVCLIGFLCITANIIVAQQLHPAERSKTARTVASNFKTTIEFRNESDKTIKVYWLDENGSRKFAVTLAPKQNNEVQTYLSQPWIVTDERDNALSLYYPDAQPRVINFRDKEITGSNRGNRDFDEDYDDPKVKYDETPIRICANQEIPRGYLIIGTSSDWGCPNWSATGKNNYTIKRPSRTEPTNVCANQTIPRGYVITRAYSDWGCSNWSATGKNAYTLTRPKDEQTMCSISETPRGFVVISTYSDWGCPDWTATGKNAKKIKRVN